MTERFSGTCSKLPITSLQAHQTETANTQLNNYRSPTEVLLHASVKNTEIKLLGVTDPRLVLSLLLQQCNQMNQLAHISIKAAMVLYQVKRSGLS